MFRKAERKKAKLRLALCAPSGGGKTYSALLIAKGLGGKIALIDTENGSGELYANLCDYDVCTITPPFSPDKYIKAIKAAEDAGYSTIIIDSLSHAWAGSGGLLEEVDKRTASSTKGNSYTAWRDITPMHNAFVDAMIQSKSHIIATMRSKTAYELEKGSDGKVKPVKVGLAPVQRDGMEYEFTIVFDISVDKHIATTSKDRTGIFDGRYVTLGIDTGQTLLSWLEDGKEPFDISKLNIQEITSIDELEKVYTANKSDAEQSGKIKEFNVTISSRKKELEQRAKKIQLININFKDVDRDKKIETVSTLIGRDIESTNNLTDDEILTVLDYLKVGNG